MGHFAANIAEQFPVAFFQDFNSDLSFFFTGYPTKTKKYSLLYYFSQGEKRL